MKSEIYLVIGCAAFIAGLVCIAIYKSFEWDRIIRNYVAVAQSSEARVYCARVKRIEGFATLGVAGD